MNFEISQSNDEDLYPRNQNPQWGISTPLKSPNPRTFLQSPLHDQFQSHFSNSQSRTKQNPTITVLESQTIFTSFDIYGNELNVQEEDSSECEEKPVEVDRTWDGGFKEQIRYDKENGNLALSIITPLKKRNGSRTNSARGSVGINRSPLLDITPGLSVKKTTLPQEFKIEGKEDNSSNNQRVLMYGGTPNRDGFIEKNVSGVKGMR